MLPFLKFLRFLRPLRLFKNKFRASNAWGIPRLIFVFSLLAHWIGCAWYVCVDRGDTGLERYFPDYQFLVSTELEAGEENFVLGSAMGSGTFDDRWLVSFFVAVSILLGNIREPDERLEYWIHIAAFLLGAILQAYIFGQVALLIADQNSTTVKWKQKMENVRAMMVELKLPKDLQQRIENYYEYFWKRHRGINHAEVFSDLSRPLLSEISLDLHFTAVQNVSFFSGCPPHFLVGVVQKLSPRIYLPGDYIVVIGQFGSEMYFIKTGRCKVIDQEDMVLITLNDGSSFGEIALYGRGFRRTASVIATSYCDLSVLTRRDFTQLVQDYPDMQVKIAERAKEAASALENKGLSHIDFQKLHAYKPLSTKQSGRRSSSIAMAQNYLKRKSGIKKPAKPNGASLWTSARKKTLDKNRSLADMVIVSSLTNQTMRNMKKKIAVQKGVDAEEHKRIQKIRNLLVESTFSDTAKRKQQERLHGHENTDIMDAVRTLANDVVALKEHNKNDDIMAVIQNLAQDVATLKEVQQNSVSIIEEQLQEMRNAIVPLRLA